MKKIVKAGEILPKCYGIAYYQWWSDNAICYPIPINILVAIGRKLRIWLGRYHGTYKTWYDDYLWTIRQVSEVYCAITNNQMSKHNYPANSVISMFEECHLDKSITQDDVNMFIEQNTTYKGLVEDLKEYFDLDESYRIGKMSVEVDGKKLEDR